MESFQIGSFHGAICVFDFSVSFNDCSFHFGAE